MKSPVRTPFTVIVLVALAYFLSGCAQLAGERSSSMLAEIEDVSTGALQTLPSVVVQNGVLSILHTNKGGRVVLQSGAQSQLLDTTARVKNGASYLQLNPTGSGLQALWWSHDDGKNIYFTSRAAPDQAFADVSMVNDDHGVLPPYSVANGEKTGAVGVAYQDERLPRFQTFFNRSLDAGRTWPRPDIRLDAPVNDSRSSFVAETHLVQTSKVWLTVWVDSIPSSEGPFRIIARESNDEGQTWAPPKTLFVGQRHISALKVLARGSNIAVLADELKLGVFAVTSSDHGQHWRTTAVAKGSEDATNSGIEASMGDANVHLVWNLDREGQKTRIQVATVAFDSGEWAGPSQRLDVKSLDNTRSEVPVLAQTSTGVAVAAWVDYRDIRPNIYLAASYDHGKSWTEPQPVRKPGTLSLGWPRLHAWGEDIALAFEIYPNDKNREGRFGVQKIAVGRDSKEFTTNVSTPVVTEAQRKARLEQRVSALWDARIKADFATAYDFFDFAYKASTPKKNYVDNSGVITYLSAAIDKIDIRGNEADVTTKLRYEMKPFILPTTGKPISVVPIDVDSPGSWVWVSDDWYLVYSPAFDVPVLRY